MNKLITIVIITLMTNNLITIKLLPKKIKKCLCNNKDKHPKFIGNINVSTSYIIRIIELEEKKRLWLLKHEIINNNLYNYNENKRTNKSNTIYQ